MSVSTNEMTLESADAMVNSALRKAREMKLKPLAVVVLDAGGHLVCAKREDSAGLLRYRIAYGKAWGALGMSTGSRTLKTMSGAHPVFVSALVGVAEGNLVPMPAGILILNPEKKILGAIGISGDSADQDEACGISAIQAAGLLADIGA